jgi:hypothetical protein
VDGRGLLHEHWLVALESHQGRQPCALPAIPWADLAAAALAAARRRLVVVRASAAPRIDAETARETALASAVETVPPAAVQPGLFDRRALRAAEAAREERARLQAEATVRLHDLQRAAAIDLAGPPRLALAAFVRGAW